MSDLPAETQDHSLRAIQELTAVFFAHRDGGRLFEAAQIGKAILGVAPNFTLMWIEYGRVIKALGMLDLGIFCFRRAGALEPDALGPPLLLGHALLEKAGATRTARPEYCDSLNVARIAVDQIFIVEIFNLAFDLSNAGFFEESAACYGVVTKYRPDVVQAHYGVACALLSLARYQESVPILLTWYGHSVKDLNLRMWHGEDLAGKVLYVYADHGLGDLVQYIRYLPIVAQQCAKVIFMVPRSLWRIIGTIPNVEFVEYNTQPYHHSCSLFMLPHVVGILRGVLPSVPYLSTDAELEAKWAARLPKTGFRIGVAWQGNPESLLDRGRSIPLAHYAPIARLPGVTLVSIQMNFGLDQLNSLPEGMTVTTLGPDYNAGPDNVVDTAAVMRSLDLIITSDTSVPHIAGALGVPVWVVVKSVPDWRWLPEGQDGSRDCPWYPTMRLFRQKAPGEWAVPVAEMVAELEKLLEARSQAGQA